MKITLPQMTMQYRSITQLNGDIVAWLPRLPRDIGLVVGIPRSGLLAANLIALHLNLPLADLDGFVAKRILGGGERLGHTGYLADTQKNKVLIVDDSFASGNAMTKARQKLRNANLTDNLYFAAIYILPGSEDKLDFFAQTVAGPRAFEWNILHHQYFIPNSCMDIDGVLCRDPSEMENDDGPNYLRFITETAPIFIPTYCVPYLVTSRLEKYRPETEAWLKKHKIPYRELRMLDLPNAAERRRLGCHASFKASVYENTATAMFYESSALQASEIANRTGKFVFCTDTREMNQPSVVARSRWFSKEVVRKVAKRLGVR